MDELEKQFGKLTDDERKLLLLFFKLDKVGKAYMLAKAEAICETCKQLSEMFSVKATE